MHSNMPKSASRWGSCRVGNGEFSRCGAQPRFRTFLMRQITAFTGEVRHDSGGLVPGHVSWHLAKIAGSEPLPPPELIVTPSYRWRSPQVHLAGASEHAGQITDSVPSRQVELGHAAICSW